MILTLDPYCGSAAAPQLLIEAWNFDPFLLLSIAVLGALTWPVA